MNRILGRAIYQLRKCKMRHVEANPKANLAVEASGQVAAGMRTYTQSKIPYTRQHLQGKGGLRVARISEGTYSNSLCAGGRLVQTLSDSGSNGN